MTAPENVRVQIAVIDRNMAEKLLSFEKQPEKGLEATNRKFSQDVVNRYAATMARGKWGFSHQGFACTGYIDDGTAEFKDGGQRCRALLLLTTTGVTHNGIFYPPQPDFSFEVFLTEGLDEDSWLVMDQMRLRSPRDHMQMKGKANPNVLGSVARLSYLYDNVPYTPDRWRKFRMEMWDREDYIEKNPRLEEAILHGGRLSNLMAVASASTAWFQAVESGMDEGILKQFYDAAQSGANLAPGSPVLALQRLMRNNRGKIGTDIQLAVLIKAIKKFAKGEDQRVLHFRTDKDVRGGSEPFPRF